MEQKPDGGAFHIFELWNHGAAVGSKRMEYQDGCSYTKTRSDDSLDYAERCPWSGLCQLFPVENVYDGNGDLLAWNTGLFGKG